MNSSSNEARTTGASGENALKMAGSSSLAPSSLQYQRRLASTLLELLDVLRDATDDPELPAQTLAMLLHVASRDEAPGIVELAKLAGVSQASSSRVVQILGRGTKTKKGLELVVAEEDPNNWSRRQVKLTPKGQRLMEGLAVRFDSALKRFR
jgi:DNA-binding MarR family transcriptional regulator